MHEESGLCQKVWLIKCHADLVSGKNTSIIKLNEKSPNKSLGGCGLLFISEVQIELQMGKEDARRPR